MVVHPASAANAAEIRISLFSADNADNADNIIIELPFREIMEPW